MTESRDSALNLDGSLLVTQELPEDLHKLVAETKAGDSMLYRESDKLFHVINIIDTVPSVPQPFEAVSDLISKTVFNDKLNAEISKWAEKLKAYYEVKSYITELQ